MTSQSIIILITLFLSAFFSGMEIAFISANKLKIELDKKNKSISSSIVDIFITNPGQYIATMLVGNNIALVVYGIVMANILEPLIARFTSSEILILSVQTLLSTLLVLITAEFLPKTLFRLNPNRSINNFALPVMFFYLVFYPITLFTIFLSGSLLKFFFKVDIIKQKEKAFGKVDLDNFVNESQKNLQEDNKIKDNIKIFQNALDFSNVKLRECIVPRTDIIALEVNSTIEDLKQKFIETGFSKIPIYQESIDNIIGYVQSSELYNLPENIESMIIKLIIVPETMPAQKLLNLFMKERKSIALVVDEFGGTSGIVTTEDIIEEIFGEIEDEHDTNELVEKKINNNEFVFSGRMEIDYINEKYKLNIPESDDYETIAGFILYNYERIPNQNDKISIPPYDFIITKIDKPRIELIKLIKK